jgi:glycine/D-amino acid oxidase-like deaminating enzyme
MSFDFILVGQGLCGTWLSYFLHKEKKSFLVIDNNHPGTASRVAAGIINPVTGRRMVKTWMIDELIPFIQSAYDEFGNELGIPAIREKTILDFFPTVQMRQAFLERLQDNAGFLYLPENEYDHYSFFNFELGYGMIQPAFMVQLETILPAWRKKLQSLNQFWEEEFDCKHLEVQKDKIRYKDISAEKIIFCDGISSYDNPYFKHLPFAFNKGEALLIEAPDLPVTHIYKKGIVLAPLQQAGIFWAGSNYLWDYHDALPTRDFFERTKQQLKDWLKVPFSITDHRAAIRPANIERRPFVGIHPHHPTIAILNGMGTKGCSLSPYFAKQLCDHLICKKEILPEADIKRFSKTLSR